MPFEVTPRTYEALGQIRGLRGLALGAGLGGALGFLRPADKGETHVTNALYGTVGGGLMGLAGGAAYKRLVHPYVTVKSGSTEPSSGAAPAENAVRVSDVKKLAAHIAGGRVPEQFLDVVPEVVRRLKTAGVVHISPELIAFNLLAYASRARKGRER